MPNYSRYLATPVWLVLLYCWLTISAAHAQLPDSTVALRLDPSRQEEGSAPSARELATLLTQEEEYWLSQYSSIRVAVLKAAWPPFDMLEGERYRGISADYLALLQRRFQLRLQLVAFDTWDAAQRAAQGGTVDLLTSVAHTPQRDEFLEFTRPYVRLTQVIVARKDAHDVSSTEELAAKRVVVERGYITEQRVRELNPAPAIMLVDTTQEALQAVATGKADAYIGDHVATTYLMEQEYLRNLEIKAPSGFPASSVRFAVREPLGILARILDKGLASITEQEHQAINRVWVGKAAASAALRNVALSRSERTWLAEHKRIRIGAVHALKPLNYLDQHGRHAGLAAEYMQQLSSHLGVEFEAVGYRTLADVYAAAQRREIDLIPLFVRTSEREQYLQFSEPLLNLQFFLVGRSSTPHVDGLDALAGRTLAVARGHAAVPLIMARFPSIHLKLARDGSEAMHMVASKQADVAIESLPFASEQIQSRYLGVLKIAGAIREEFPLSIAIRKDWPQLTPLVDRAIASIDPEEHARLHRKWLAPATPLGTNWREVARVGVPIGAALLGAVVVMLIWNRRLRHQITERRRAEVALEEQRRIAHEAEERLRNITDRIPGAVYQYYRAPDGRFGLRFMSAGISDILGVTPETALRDFQTTFTHVVEEDRPALFESIKQSGRSMSRWQHEFRVRHEDGQTRWLQSGSEPRREADGTLVWDGVLVDITAHKDMEAALELARQQADSANRAKSAFLAAMSHEIRTPLSSMIGMLEILQGSPLEAEQTEMVELIRESADNLLVLLNQVLDYSKIEAEQVTLERTEFDLRELIESIASLAAPNADSKDVELLCHVGNDVPRRVAGDPARLRQVLSNLVSNAVKFTDSGFVLLRARAQSLAQQQCQIMLEVIDSGIGIAPEQRSRIFQAFSQADDSITRRYGGSGLGLTISSRLVNLMGGELRIDDAPADLTARGSRFWCLLPFEVQAPASAAPVSLSGVIAIVSGERAPWCQAVADYLRFCACAVTTSSSAGNTAALLNSHVAAEQRVLCVVSLAHAVELQQQRIPMNAALLLAAPPQNAQAQALLQQGKVHAMLRNPFTRERLYREARVALGFESASATGGQTQPSRVTRTPSGDMLVLIADDNRANQIVAERQLKQLGYRCQLTASGTDAWEVLIAEPDKFSLLITDGHMPGLDGAGLTQRIRKWEADQARAKLPIVMLSASRSSEEVTRAERAGVDEYCLKPLDLATLSALLDRWLPTTRAPSRAANAAPSSTQRDTQDLLDLEQLKQLVDSDEADVLAEILQAGRRSLLHTPRDLSAALHTRDGKLLKRVSHGAKGSAMSVGAARFARLMGELESSCDRNDWSAAEQLAQQAPSEHAALLEAMEQTLARLASPQVG